MIVLVPITAENVAAFKAVRLAALEDSPTAFGSSYAQESQLSDDEWLKRAARCATQGIGYLVIDTKAKVACGIVRGSRDDQDPGLVWLQSMWVAAARRRTGLGRRLVEAVVAWARGQQMRAVKLHVTSNNQPALRFYERMGFRLTGTSQPHPREAALSECEMLLPLS